MKLLEMGKDMKIKHSAPPPKKRKVWGYFFLKKGEQTFLCKIIMGCFTCGLMIRSCKGGGKVSQMHFSII